MFESLTAIDPADSEPALVERIADLERIKSAAAAGQARAAAALDAARRAAEAVAGMPARRRGRGIASEIALARRDSPARGNRHLGFAKALVHEMPHTLAALEAGVLTEWRATLIVRESACLDVENRRMLDAELCSDSGDLDGMGDARVAAAAKAIAYRLDPHAVVDRAAKAETERTVSIRPAPDTMTYLTALLPVAQGVSVYAAQRRAADTCADGRSRGQVMADALVERVTGRSAAAPTPIAVNLVLSDETLLAGSNEPAGISGYGPVPAAVTREWVSRAVGDERSRATLRRLYARPTSGALVGMESRARLFPAGWQPSSDSAMSVAGRRTATRRSAISTMPGHGRPGVPPTRSTGSDCANTATMSRRSPAGSSDRRSLEQRGTQRNSRPQPESRIGRGRLRFRDRRCGWRSARWKSPSK